ncbi:hypothetical protein ACT4UT_36040, partial [Bacillus sp. B-TM1]
MKIALIAHDKKKNDMVSFAYAYKPIFEQHELFATFPPGPTTFPNITSSI